MISPQERSFSKNARIRARRSAVQALYQWQMTQIPILDVIAEFENERTELKKADVKYFRDLLQGMAQQTTVLDNQLGPLLDRPVKELDPVERAVLHIGLYELLYRPELPWRVVINESVELAKMFGAEQSYKFINGVLDKAARIIRPEEILQAP
ncbi:MAG: transcription antitermination factor NusB [Gammaproteobacteria bacterium]|nr:transcription antitermination factor NusB [Gammaproteobacteria bacterium]